jgi:hypothetical protein
MIHDWTNIKGDNIAEDTLAKTDKKDIIILSKEIAER